MFSVNYVNKKQNNQIKLNKALGTYTLTCHQHNNTTKYRYESKHRQTKATVEAAKNFINITHTVSERHQYRDLNEIISIPISLYPCLNTLTAF